MTLPPRIASSYKLIELRDTSAYAQQWLARDLEGERFRIKLYTSGEGLLLARSESTVLQQLSPHPNILPLVDYEETDDGACVVTKWIDCDLLQYLRARPPLPESEARQLFLAMIRTLEHAHSLGIAHRDIKLENILYDETYGQLYISEWEHATIWQESTLQFVPVGSLHYSAPEICRASPYVGPEIDMWSLGVVLYALVCGRLPFLGHSDRKVQKRILIASPSYPPDLSASVVSLLQGLLNPDRYLRLSVSQTLSTPWVMKNALPRSVQKDRDLKEAEEVLGRFLCVDITANLLRLV